MFWLNKHPSSDHDVILLKLLVWHMENPHTKKNDHFWIFLNYIHISFFFLCKTKHHYFILLNLVHCGLLIYQFYLTYNDNSLTAKGNCICMSYGTAASGQVAVYRVGRAGAKLAKHALSPFRA